MVVAVTGAQIATGTLEQDVTVPYLQAGAHTALAQLVDDQNRPLDPVALTVVSDPVGVTLHVSPHDVRAVGAGIAPTSFTFNRGQIVAVTAPNEVGSLPSSSGSSTASTTRRRCRRR